jgi:CBS domain-containing protein
MDSPIAISKLLRPDRIVVGLSADSYREAVDILLDRLETTGAFQDRAALDELADADSARDDPPLLAAGAILAHYRSDVVPEIAIAVGVSSEPFAFAPENAPDARILVLILASTSEAKLYLKTLAALGVLLSRPELGESLATAEDAEAFARIVASHDLVIRPELLVSDLMSRDVQTVSPETLLSETLRLMVRYGRRGVPVVSDTDEVLGMVTESEVLQHFVPQVLGTAGRPGREKEPPVKDTEVRDIMQRTVMCLSEHQLISDVLGTMLSESVSQFPVVREGKLVGFLSRTDLIEKLLQHAI